MNKYWVPPLFAILGAFLTVLYITNGGDWDHYLTHTSEYLTHASHNSWEAVLLFSVKVHKIELIFQDDECQQFILMENLLSVSDLRAPS